MGSSAKPDHNNAELYFHSTASWKQKESYPFSKNIATFALIAHTDYFILFNGAVRNEQSGLSSSQIIIAKFTPDLDRWENIGYSLFGRNAFGVIEIDRKFLLMGGRGNKRTEVCEFKDTTIKCTAREPTMKNFHYFPEMMIVPPDFADNC